MMGSGHVPVLLAEVQKYLECTSGAIVVDGTLGLGGHGAVLAQITGENGKVIGIDRDQTALAKARENLGPLAGRFYFHHGSYADIPNVLARMGIDGVDGILLDLGLSSDQLDDPERGFSFRWDGPLDMRFDRAGDGQTVEEFLNTASRHRIQFVLQNNADERFSSRIAKRIVEYRRKKRISSTNELVEVIRASVTGYKRQSIHPATRTFQALRIAVNHELEILDSSLEPAVRCLNKKARMCVISYHSGEDRVVKHAFRKMSRSGLGNVLTKKPVTSTDSEARMNPRARSAKMRVLERV